MEGRPDGGIGPWRPQSRQGYDLNDFTEKTIGRWKGGWVAESNPGDARAASEAILTYGWSMVRMPNQSKANSPNKLSELYETRDDLLKKRRF